MHFMQVVSDTPRPPVHEAQGHTGPHRAQSPRGPRGPRGLKGPRGPNSIRGPQGPGALWALGGGCDLPDPPRI